MDYGGMTVNERLYVSGNLDKFYEAIKTKDKETVIKILQEVQLNYMNILPILKNHGLEQ
jgi:molecular chaperone GrpE (heat shock protein)